jgi:hypothetical protein
MMWLENAIESLEWVWLIALVGGYLAGVHVERTSHRLRAEHEAKLDQQITEYESEKEADS